MLLNREINVTHDIGTSGADIDHQQLFEMMPVPRFVIKVLSRSHFAVVEANQKALQYFGRPREQIVGSALSDLLTANDARYFMESLDAAVRQKRPVTVKAPAGSASTPKLGNFYINPVVDPDGQITMVDVLALPAAGDSQSLQRERDDAARNE